MQNRKEDFARIAYTVCMKAVRSQELKDGVKKRWMEFSDSNGFYRGMKICDAISKMFLDEFESKGLMLFPEEDDSYLKSLYLVRKGLDFAYDEEAYFFSVKHMYSYYICRSRLHFRYGHLLLKSKRFYATSHELQLARDDLYRAMNSILDDYHGTESIISYTPESYIKNSGSLHEAAYGYKCKIVLDALDRLVTPIEQGMNLCVKELNEFIPKDYRGQLCGYHLNRITEALERSTKYGSSQDRIDALKRMKDAMSSYPETDDIYTIKYYRYMPFEPVFDMVAYVNWCVQKDLILKYSDPITRNLLPPACRDELTYTTNKDSWLVGLFDDFVKTFGHARFLLYKYNVIGQKAGDLRNSEPEIFNFYKRLDGDFNPAFDNYTIDLMDRMNLEFSIEGSTSVEYNGRIYEELLIDAFVRLYSILDKISNLVAREFSINLYYPDSSKISKPSIGGIAHYLHDENEDNPFLRILETIYIEINPDSELNPNKDFENTHYDRMPFAQTLYNLRNHIVHSELVLLSSRPKLSERKMEGKTFVSDFYENTMRLAYIVKEAIMTSMLALEFRDNENKKIIQRGQI